jgi:DNA-binding LytR/AlgR family response regulator
MSLDATFSPGAITHPVMTVSQSFQTAVGHARHDPTERVSSAPGFANGSWLGGRFAVRSASGWSLFKVAEVEWVDVAGSLLRIHEITGRVALLRDAPNTFARLLTDERFVRVGRTRMVNQEHVCAIECIRRGKFVVALASGQRLPINREARLCLAGPACSRRFPDEDGDLSLIAEERW